MRQRQCRARPLARSVARARSAAPCRAALGAALLLAAARAVPLGAQTLQELSPSRHGSEVTVFVAGNVRDVVGESGGAASTTGALGLTFRGPTYIVTGVVNALARSDTVTRAYGATLLPPATGRAFNSALVDVRRPYLPGLGCAADQGGVRARLCQVGLHAYAFASSTTWATAVDADGAATAAAEVPVWGDGIGGSYRFFDGYLPDSSHVGMALDAMLARRHLRGDFGAPAGDALRSTLLGSRDRDFTGLETAVNLRYNEMNAGLTYYYFGGDVPGFSRGQIVAAVSVRARLNGGAYSER